jgi:outer membrane immunogenic protein
MFAWATLFWGVKLIKRLSLAAVAAIGFASVASAADLPTMKPAPPPPAPPVFSWTGCYVGANAGYAWGDRTNPNIYYADPGGAVNFAGYFGAGGNGFPNLSPSGFVGGGQVGCDVQVNTWVFGAVADFQGAGVDASASAHVTPPSFVASTQSLSESLDFLGTVRGRAGVALNNWLLYASGGLAYGQARSTLTFSSTTMDYSGSDSDTRVGWVLGAGIDYAITSHWILGVDYLHYDLGRTKVTGVSVPPGAIHPGASLTASQTVAGDALRAVLNYKF